MKISLVKFGEMNWPLVVTVSIGLLVLAVLAWEVGKIVRRCRRFSKHAKAFDHALAELKRCRNRLALEAQMDQVEAALKGMEESNR